MSVICPSSSFFSPRSDKILIVDDLPDNLNLLATLLTHQGYAVRRAPSGSLALLNVPRFQPDLILLDIMMPELDGYEVCARLKADPLSQEIPVIFLSALEDALDKVRAFDVGAADYITKPFQTAEVLVRVEHQLKLLHLQRQFQYQNAQLRQEVEARKAAEIALQAANQQLQRMASLDGLTQIANRRHFDEVLDQEWKRHLRQNGPLSLILADVDHFKAFNDHYGHQAGDRCLEHIAQALQQSVRRSTDLVARYGGEEFAVLLPDTSEVGAFSIAARIRMELQRLKLSHAQSPVSNHVTLSLGINSLVPDLTLSPDLLVLGADQALYQAKQQGRDRAIAYGCDSCNQQSESNDRFRDTP